jgi:hypothetical protein
VIVRGAALEARRWRRKESMEGGDDSYNGRYGTRRPPASYLQRAAGSPPGSTRRRRRCTDCASIELASYRIGLAATRPTWNTIWSKRLGVSLGGPAGNRKAPLPWHLPPARFSAVLDGPASEEVGDRPLRGPAHARDPRSEEPATARKAGIDGPYVGVSQLVLRHDLCARARSDRQLRTGTDN